ncbi:hypothetical protein ABB02_00156 [Clostridiaceae bacterium JG1575]|nr:hypothetical protein ABB02_00156 [Clostridiaceae bacterium JG1575]
MEHIYHIRYEFNEKGKSIRQISRETGHDRQTVNFSSALTPSSILALKMDCIFLEVSLAYHS